MDGAHVEVGRFHVPEVAFDVAQVFVGVHDCGRFQGAGGQAGADDVDAVQAGFGVDLVLSAGDGEGGVGDGDVEVFGHLVFADDLADPDADRVGAGQAPGRHGSGDGGEHGLGGGEQRVAFAGAFGGQGRVVAGDQAFAGVVGMGDLGGVVGVEQDHLQRTLIGGQRR